MQQLQAICPAPRQKRAVARQKLGMNGKVSKIRLEAEIKNDSENRPCAKIASPALRVRVKFDNMKTIIAKYDRLQSLWRVL
jgi:hypothetical protein